MKRKNLFLLQGIIAAIGLSGLLMVSCKSKPMTGMIIVTQCAEKNPAADFISGEFWRYIPGSRLVALDPDKPGKSPKVLSDGFYSACSPDISYDGNFMLFAGQQKEGDAWQIWEMNLGNQKVRQITATKDNCVDPAYLPGDRFVFSRSISNDSLMAGNSLFTANREGSDIRRITFNPSIYFASGVLHDGRILTLGRQLYPDTEDPFWTVMRPDGTKASLFYKSGKNSGIFGRAWETPDGRILFTESDSVNKEPGNIVSISYNRPLHSKVDLTAGVEGDFRAVYPKSPEKLLVSYRKSGSDRYALYEYDMANHILGDRIYADQGFDVIDVNVVEEHIKPKKLPSEVDPGVKTGLLLCQDINFTDPQTLAGAPSSAKATRIEVLGLNSSYGIVNVEEDGSFYLKAIADTPIRIQTLDESGKVIHGPGAWIWLRPNERRGCIGCHEDPELAPENHAPLSVRKDPVIIPVHLKEVSEKEVELE